MGLENFREYGALILLFQSCADDRLRQQVLKLVPELVDWEPVEPTKPDRWVLHAISGDGEKLGQQVVICREVDLKVHELEFRDRFDLATNVRVTIRKVQDDPR